MKTQCSGEQLEFHALGAVTGRFDGGRLSLTTSADCDYRNPERGTRCTGIGSWKTSTTELRGDALVSLLVGKRDLTGEKRKRQSDRGYALASASTLNRLELGEPEDAARHRYKRIVSRPEALDDLLVGCLWNRIDAPHARSGWTSMRPTTRCTVTGFFHGYYRLLLSAAVHFLRRTSVVCATAQVERDGAAGRSRSSSASWGSCAGAGPRCVFRGDSGFCRESIMVVRGARYRLRAGIGAQSAPGARPGRGDVRGALGPSSHRPPGAALSRLHLPHAQVMEPAPTRSGQGGVSVQGSQSALRGHQSLAAQGLGQALVRKALLRARRHGEPHQGATTDLFADRTSTHTMRANQLRLYFSSFAYVLMTPFEDSAPKAPSWPVPSVPLFA